MKEKLKALIIFSTVMILIFMLSDMFGDFKHPLRKYVVLNSYSNTGYNTSSGKSNINSVASQNTMRNFTLKNTSPVKKDNTSKSAVCKLDFTCNPVTGQKRNDTDFKPYDFDTLRKRHPSVANGGVWEPSGCKPRASIVLIVPYNDREEHLKIFINNMILLFQKQKLAFRILLVEQQNSTTIFNRAMLLNIGYLEALKLGHDSCFILHDVDYVAENWCNFYVCEEQPRHMTVMSNKYKYRLIYHSFIGGGIAVNNKTMTRVHGFSNIYYGWGSEDDDFYGRLTRQGYFIRRYNNNIARYRTLDHDRDKRNPAVEKHTKPSNGKFLRVDGFTTVKYKLVSKRLQPLFTNITVTFDGPTNSTEATKAFTVNTNKLEALLAGKSVSTKK